MSTQAITRFEQTEAVSRYEQREVIETIKQTVCRGASDAQLKMFIEVCKSTGLNPFLKEIWYVAEKGIIMAARDGYLRVANEHPQFDGMETRVERDDKGTPIKAVCTVWRKDRNHPVTCEAYYSEYNKNSPVWRQYPSAMISKVSEVLALKRSFTINGVVTEEEVGDGVGGPPAMTAQQVAETKLKVLQSGGTVQEADAAVAEVLTPEPEPPSEIEQQLHESIKQVEVKKAKSKKPLDFFAYLQSIQAMKKRLEAVGQRKRYYEVLAMWGLEKSNQINKDDRDTATKIYKELSLAASDEEALARQNPERMEAALAEQNRLKDVEGEN